MDLECLITMDLLRLAKPKGPPEISTSRVHILIRTGGLVKRMPLGTSCNENSSRKRALPNSPALSDGAVKQKACGVDRLMTKRPGPQTRLGQMTEQVVS